MKMWLGAVVCICWAVLVVWAYLRREDDAVGGYGRGERAETSVTQLIRGVRVTMPVRPRRIRAVG